MARKIKVRDTGKGFMEVTIYKMGLKDGFNFSRQGWFEDK